MQAFALELGGAGEEEGVDFFFGLGLGLSSGTELGLGLGYSCGLGLGLTLLLVSLSLLLRELGEEGAATVHFEMVKLTSSFVSCAEIVA